MGLIVWIGESPDLLESGDWESGLLEELGGLLALDSIRVVRIETGLHRVVVVDLLLGELGCLRQTADHPSVELMFHN